MSTNGIRNVSHETSRTPLLVIEGVSKSYDATLVLDDLSLALREGEVVSLLGPSGSGKSTLLRCIAGLIPLDRGRILVEGQDVAQLPPYARGFGMMFQQFALFPHRTVAQNIAFGLRMQRWSATTQQARVEEMLALVGLQGYGRRSIFELSGGEQQRVALARSLAPQPRFLMLDEPLGSLDRALRERLSMELREILRRVGLTALYVTHDQEEAFAISDRLILLDQGAIVQEGSAETLYRHPATRFAATFFGHTNQLPVLRVEPQSGGYWQAETALGPLTGIEGPPQPTLLLRPEAAQLSGSVNRVEGIVTECLFRGGYYRVAVRYGTHTLHWDVAASELPSVEVGSRLVLFLEPRAITFLAD